MPDAVARGASRGAARSPDVHVMREHCSVYASSFSVFNCDYCGLRRILPLEMVACDEAYPIARRRIRCERTEM